MKVRTLRSRYAARTPSTRHGRLLIASGLSVAGMLSSGGAFAQAAAGPAMPASAAARSEANAPASSLETVTVTARKTTERLQDVPLAITAISNKTMQDAGVKNVQDIAKLTPGITVNAGGAEALLSITVRGMTNLNAGSGDPNVALFLDGVYLANPSAISLGLVDIERVEVIKGPVSALYGRNAFAGVVNYVSKKPVNELEANASYTLSNAGGSTRTASISGPMITGLLAARLTIGQDESQGTQKDQVNGNRAGGFRKNDTMLSFNLTPSPTVSITGAGYLGDDFFKTPPITYMDNNCGTKSVQPVSAGQFTQYCGKLNTEQHPIEVATLNPTTGATGNHRRVFSGNTKLSIDLGGIGDVSALVGYNKVTSKRFLDFTGQRDGIPFTTSQGITNLKEIFGGDANNSDKSIEVRMSTKQNQRLRAAGGLYYFEANSTLSTLIGIDGSPLKPGQVLTGALAPTQNLYLTSDGSFSKSNLTLVNFTDRVLSPFASVEYDILSALTGTLEARRTKETKTQDIIRNSGVANTVRPFGAPQSNSEGFNNYRGGLRYKLNDDAMVYATAANGTKAGGFNQRATIQSEYAFKPETNLTLELGSKASFLQKRLQLGIAVFHIKSKDMQIQGPSDDPTNTGLVTKNFGGTKSNGIDFDFAAVPLRGLTLTGGIGYSDPKFDSGSYDYSNGGQCALIPSCAGRVTTVASAQGPKSVINLDGLHVPRASKVTATLGAQYEGRISDDWGYFARADLRYETKQYSQPSNFAFWSDRKVVNLNAGIKGDRYTVKLYVNNLTNNQTPETVTPNTKLNDFVANQVAYLPPLRTYGVTVGIQY